MLSKTSSKANSMKISLDGIPASFGIAIGKAVLYTSARLVAIRKYVTDVENEIDRIKEAFILTQKELQELSSSLANEGNRIFSDILGAQIIVLEDPTFIEGVTNKIKEDKCNAEYAFIKFIEDAVAKFRNHPKPMIQEKADDVYDIGKRVMRHLSGEEISITPSKLEPNSIIISHDLSPSDTAQMDPKTIGGLAIDTGGRTSHTAILARAHQIPAVVGLKDISEQVKNGQTVIIDGNQGRVIIDPDKETEESYTKLQSTVRAQDKALEKLRLQPAETLDGFNVDLAANIEFPQESALALRYGAKGVGLFRTEFLYLSSQEIPTEETQYEVYHNVARTMYPDSVVVRTLDLGGDKFYSKLNLSSELNPFLGWRAIRFCLERQDIFRTQLRAILRANVVGNLKIMYPMISGIDEVRQANEILQDVANELKSQGIEHNSNIQIGIMIEVPSAVLVADALAKEVSFFSIGTNDLIQYTLAVDRVNEKMAYLYEPLHPAVLKLIKETINAAHANDIWVGMCGEMAGDPNCTAVLLGLGLDELSMSPVAVPAIKRLIRSTILHEIQDLAQAALQFSTPGEVKKFLKENSPYNSFVSVK